MGNGCDVLHAVVCGGVGISRASIPDQKTSAFLAWSMKMK